MFGRSQSGPGGLSINTTSANTLSSQSAEKPSLFANLGNSQSQNPAPSQPQQTSSLFGNSSQAQPAGGLFGSSTPAAGNQQSTQNSSLFSNTQGAQTTGGGLLGTQLSQQPAGGLFGSTNTQPAQPQQGGGLFASLNQKQDSNPQPQSSLFGASNNQNKAPSLFGNTQVPTQNQQAGPQALTGSLFSNQIGHSNKQTTIPGVAISINELRPTTRFNDLQEDLQSRIEGTDNFILGQIRRQEDCAAANDKIEDLCLQMPSDIDHCVRSLDTVQQALENDAQSIAFVKKLVNGDYGDANVSLKVIQNLSLPQQFHRSTLQGAAQPSRNQALLISDDVGGAPTNIVEYFMQQADEMNTTLTTFERNITEVETYLKEAEFNTMQQMQQMMVTRTREGGSKSPEDQVRELAAVLREFGNGILGVASKVGDTKEAVQEVMLGQ